jgi:hypothetical protein
LKQRTFGWECQLHVKTQTWSQTSFTIMLSMLVTTSYNFQIHFMLKLAILLPCLGYFTNNFNGSKIVWSVGVIEFHSDIKRIKLVISCLPSSIVLDFFKSKKQLMYDPNNIHVCKFINPCVWYPKVLSSSCIFKKFQNICCSTLDDHHFEMEHHFSWILMCCGMGGLLRFN